MNQELIEAYRDYLRHPDDYPTISNYARLLARSPKPEHREFAENWLRWGGGKIVYDFCDVPLGGGDTHLRRRHTDRPMAVDVIIPGAGLWSGAGVLAEGGAQLTGGIIRRSFISGIKSAVEPPVGAAFGIFAGEVFMCGGHDEPGLSFAGAGPAWARVSGFEEIPESVYVPSNYGFYVLVSATAPPTDHRVFDSIYHGPVFLVRVDRRGILYDLIPRVMVEGEYANPQSSSYHDYFETAVSFGLVYPSSLTQLAEPEVPAP